MDIGVPWNGGRYNPQKFLKSCKPGDDNIPERMVYFIVFSSCIGFETGTPGAQHF